MAIDIEDALVYKLVNTVAIAAIISSRCHPLRLPDSDESNPVILPAIVYSQIDAPIVTTHDATAADALTHARYQVDAWATTYTGAVALAAAIFTALEGFSGIVTSGIDTFMIQACLRVDKRTNNDSETGLYWISQDFTLWYLGG